MMKIFIMRKRMVAGTPAVVLDGKSKDAQTCKQLMSNMGLAGLMANSGDEYIRKAVELASNLN